MSSPLYIVTATCTCLFLFAIVRMVRKRRLRAKYSFLWLMVGAVLLVLSIVPNVMESIASAVGIVYAPALLFLGAIMLLLFIAVHFSWELSRLEDRTRTLVEELALANARIDDLAGETRRSVPFAETGHGSKAS